MEELTALRVFVFRSQRGDVAATISALFDLALQGDGSAPPAAKGLAIDMIQQGKGKDVPVREAVEAAVDKREGSLVV